MSKLLRSAGLIGLGLLVGLGLLWLSSLSSGGSANRPVVINSSTSAIAKVSTSPSTQSSPIIGPLPVPTAPPRPITPPGIGGEYIALGDSVAYGLGAPNSNEQGYAGIFYNNYLKRLQPNLTVYRNLAVAGETSTTFLTATKGRSQLQRLLDELDTASRAGRRVSPVSLSIGGNDLLNIRNKSTAEREAAQVMFEANYIKILDELKGRLNGAELIVTTYYNPDGYQTGNQDEESRWVLRFNEVIRQRGSEHGAMVADFFVSFAGQERNLTWATSGDVHPTPAGHAVLAQAVWKASGYDKQPPSVALIYSPLGSTNQVTTTSRLVFKLSARDEWGGSTFAPADLNFGGAGTIYSATATLDKLPPSSLAGVPGRYAVAASGSREFTFIIDATGLNSGPHTLHFEAQDAAGNAGSLDVAFVIT